MAYLVQVYLSYQLNLSVVGGILNKSEKANYGSYGSYNLATVHEYVAFSYCI